MKGYAGSPSKAKKSAIPKWVQDKYDDKEKEREVKRTQNREGRNIYRTKRWNVERKLYIQQHPICEKCKRIGLTTEAKVLDHIIPIRSGGAIWDKDNWMALCRECDNIKRGKESYGKIHDGKDNGKGELIPKDRWQVM